MADHTYGGYPSGPGTGKAPNLPKGPAPGSAPREDVAAPLVAVETLVLGPDDQLVVRVSPDRVRSLMEFDEFTARLKAAFKDCSRPPVVVVADQLAVQRTADSTT